MVFTIYGPKKFLGLSIVHITITRFFLFGPTELFGNEKKFGGTLLAKISNVAFGQTSRKTSKYDKKKKILSTQVVALSGWPAKGN